MIKLTKKGNKATVVTPHETFTFISCEMWEQSPTQDATVILYSGYDSGSSIWLEGIKATAFIAEMKKKSWAEKFIN